MTLVAGESLIDLIVEPHGGLHACPGGGPFNAARTIARLGHPTQFIGRLSTDPFGQLLTDKLAQDRVKAVPADPVEAPTDLAIVTVSAAGVPRHWFHLAGTAGFLWTARQLSMRSRLKSRQETRETHVVVLITHRQQRVR